MQRQTILREQKKKNHQEKNSSILAVLDILTQTYRPYISKKALPLLDLNSERLPTLCPNLIVKKQGSYPDN